MQDDIRKVRTWIKERPLLLPYVAVISTLELYLIWKS